jgi:hypothetical protein
LANLSLKEFETCNGNGIEYIAESFHNLNCIFIFRSARFENAAQQEKFIYCYQTSYTVLAGVGMSDGSSNILIVSD